MAECPDFISALEHIVNRVKTIADQTKNGDLPKIDVTPDDAYYLCYAVQLQFLDLKLGDDFTSNHVVTGYQDQLTLFSTSFIKLLEAGFDQEQVLWSMCVLARFASVHANRHTKIRDLVLQNLIMLSRLLSADFHDALLQEFVASLMDVLTKQTTDFCFNSRWPIRVINSKQRVFEGGPVKMDASKPDVLPCVVQCFLNVFLFDKYDFTQLPSPMVQRLFLCVIQLSDDLRLAKLCITLMHRLVQMDLCRSILFVNFLDVSLSYLKAAIRNPEALNFPGGKLVIQAAESALEMSSRYIRGRQPRMHLKGASFWTFAPFLRPVVAVILEKQAKHMKLIRFTTSCLTWFNKSSVFLDQKVHLKELSDQCVHLFEFIILECESDTAQFISDIVTFLIDSTGIETVCEVVNKVLVTVQASPHSGKIRQTLITGLNTVSDAATLLQSVVPTDEELLAFFEAIRDDKLDYEALGIVMDVTSKLFCFYNGCQDTLLAFLSLPWICEVDWTIWQRQSKSLPLLVEAKKAESRFRALLSTPELKIEALKALAQLSGKNEWRGEIFKMSLASKYDSVVLAALDALPLLLQTYPTFPFESLVIPMMDALACKEIDTESNDPSFIQAIFKMLGSCICVSSRNTTVATGQLTCCVCDNGEGTKRTLNFKVPSSLPTLIRQIMAVNVDVSDVILALINLINSILRHIKAMDDEEIITTILPLAGFHGGIPTAFTSCLQEIVQLDLSVNTVKLIQEEIAVVEDESSRMEFYDCLVKHANLPEFRQFALLEAVCTASVRTHRANKIVKKAVDLVQVFADREGIRPRSVFCRNAFAVCNRTSHELIRILNHVKTIENGIVMNEDVLTSVIDYYFVTLSVIFNVSSTTERKAAIKILLDAAAPYFVPFLLLSRAELTELCYFIYRYVSMAMHATTSALMFKVIAYVFYVASGVRKVPWNAVLTERVMRFSGNAMYELVNRQQFQCIANLVFNLGVDEAICRTYLEEIMKMTACGESDQPFSYTRCIKPYYLGILLELRQAFADEVFYNYRSQIVQSICKLIDILDTKFIFQSPSKMLALLKSATPPEIAIEAWMTFVRKMTIGSMQGMLHQVLLAVAALYDHPAASRLIQTIFDMRKGADSSCFDCIRFDRAVVVLSNSERPFLRNLPKSNYKVDDLVTCCAGMLMEESVDVHALVLPRLLQVLESQTLPIGVVPTIIHALLHTLKSANSSNTRRLVGICLGKIGAIDPGRVGMVALGTALERRAPVALGPPFVDNIEDFFYNLLESCGRLLTECTEPNNIDFIGCALQKVFRELAAPEMKAVEQRVCSTLPPECSREITPFRTSSFKMTYRERPDSQSMPFIEHAADYNDWLQRWYYVVSSSIGDGRLARVFEAFRCIFLVGDTRFSQAIMTQAVLQILIEGNADVTRIIQSEIVAVFTKALTTSMGWIRFAAHTCFQVIEFIEKYEVARMRDGRMTHALYNRIIRFLSAVISYRTVGKNELLSVSVAEKYNCSCRALRWLEQYGIEVKPIGTVVFDRGAMYMLEQIYIQLGDTDGVLGAYDTIQMQTNPLPHEQVIAYEATGDYTEALPLYQKEPVQRVPLIKCLLQLNQPLLAFTTSDAFLHDEKSPSTVAALADYRMEAACKLGYWSYIRETLASDPEKPIFNWGAHIAAVLSGVEERSQTAFEKRVDRARMQLMDSLQAVTMEDADTYAQAYRYVLKLHILSEVEEAASSMKLFDGEKPSRMIHLLSKWEDRSDNAIQCSGVLEPIYSTRRQLLHFADPTGNKKRICEYHIESCRLARSAGHLSTAWSHLINARSLEVDDTLHIDMEEARYLFQRGEQSQAIAALQKSLEKYFPEQVNELNSCIRKNGGQPRTNVKTVAEKTKLPEARATSFVDAQLLLTSFMDKANAANISELFDRYSYLINFEKRTEKLSYEFAVFYDNNYYNRNPHEFSNALLVENLYKTVIRHGHRYLLHVMPRMLTIWLDFTSWEANKIAAEMATQPSVPVPKGRKKSASLLVATAAAAQEPTATAQITDLILDAFGRLDWYYFYTAFSQLVSHICHPSEKVYKALEEMIGGLIVTFPHQCLWQAIASYRADEKLDAQRRSRTRRIFQAAIVNQASEAINLRRMIEQYDFVAGHLISVGASGKLASGAYKDFNKAYPKLASFFTDKKSKVSLPFIGMVDKRRPTLKASQFVMPEHNLDDDTVYIKGFDDDYYVFSSLEKPKRISMIGTNGKKYPLIAKCNDELRKDSRVMEFCGMVNTLLLREPEARRRQLHIRTYCVIPLQGKGGIIEFVPNMTTFKSALKAGRGDTDLKNRWHTTKNDAAMRRKIYEGLVENNPVSLADYFRRRFPDPCKWYAARQAFTRTAATMSMVGFVLGLGDRHGDNILIDLSNGEVMHVDFNILFNKGEELPCPEIVPFRLTRNMIDGFGPTGVEGAFRRSCEVVMRILRDEQAMLCTVLQTFVHDPLLEWNKLEQRNQQMRADSKKPTDTPTGSVAELELIRCRLSGNIVTRRFLRPSKSVVPMSVEGQVAQLLRMASDPNTLAQMYIGWGPYL